MFLNYSRAKTWWDCHRRWALQYYFRWRPEEEDEPLSMGTGIHEGVAGLYLGHSVSEAAEAATVKYLKLRSEHHEGLLLEEWKEGSSYIAKMINLYAQRETPIDDFTVNHVERVGAAKLGEICYECGVPYPTEESTVCCRCGSPVHYWVGQIDLDVIRNDEPGILDHKSTASTPSDDWLNQWERSFQLVGYAYIRSKETGKLYKQVGINALQKARSLGEPSAETKQCTDCRGGAKKRITCQTCHGAGRVEKLVPLVPFRRKWFYLTDVDFDRFILYAHSTIKRIREEIELFIRDSKAAFPMNDQACRRCPFKDFCWSGDSVVKWHEFENPPDGFVRRTDYVEKMTVAAEEVF